MTMASPHPTLIAAPGFAFEQLDAALASLGWQLDSEGQEAPLIEGEPEVAVFTRTRGDARVHYTFNPVIRLRVLQFRGADAAAEHARVASKVPILKTADLEALVSSSEVREVLLGLLAAEESRERSVLSSVATLRSHEDPRIARTALRVDRALGRAEVSGPS